MSPASYDMYTQRDLHSDTSSEYEANFQLPRETEYLLASSTTDQGIGISAPFPVLQRAKGKILEEEEELRQDKDEVYYGSEPDDEGMDVLLRDLIEAQERLQERDQEIAKKDEELEQLRGLVSNLEATQEKEILEVQNKEVALQQTVDRLTSALEEKDRDLRSKESELSERKVEWETALRQLEQQRKEQLEELRKKIAQSNGRLDESQEAQGSSVGQEHERVGVKELESATMHATESELERITAQAAEIVSLRSLLEFFKSNSERVASKNREIMEENRRMQEAVEVGRQSGDCGAKVVDKYSE